MDEAQRAKLIYEKTIDKAFHVSLCRQCGRCCTGCRFLNAQNRCEIYAERFELNPDCMDLEGAIAHGALPDDCPYMEGVERGD